MLHEIFLFALLAFLSLKELLVPHNYICASEFFLLFNSESSGICVDLWLECVACFFVDLLSENLLPLRLLLTVDVEVIQALTLAWLEVLVA
jgi:hypothetical protein